MDRDSVHTVVISLHADLVDGNEFWDCLGFTRPDKLVTLDSGDTRCVWWGIDEEDMEEVDALLEEY